MFPTTNRKRNQKLGVSLFSISDHAATAVLPAANRNLAQFKDVLLRQSVVLPSRLTLLVQHFQLLEYMDASTKECCLLRHHYSNHNP